MNDSSFRRTRQIAMHLHQQSIKIKQLPRSLKEHFSKLTLHFHTFGQPQERRIKKKRKEKKNQRLCFQAKIKKAMDPKVPKTVFCSCVKADSSSPFATETTADIQKQR